jgi:hypothetical protein
MNSRRLILAPNPDERYRNNLDWHSRGDQKQAQSPNWVISDFGARSCEVRFTPTSRRGQVNRLGPKTRRLGMSRHEQGPLHSAPERTGLVDGLSF